MKLYIKNTSKFVTLAAVLIFSASITAYAGALLSDPLEKNEPAPKKQAAPIGTAVTGAGNLTPIIKAPDVPQKMSCWQYGKLILEQTVIAPKNKISDTRLLENPATGEAMLAFDFKNAFCFIK